MSSNNGPSNPAEKNLSGNVKNITSEKSPEILYSRVLHPPENKLSVLLEGRTPNPEHSAKPASEIQRPAKPSQEKPVVSTIASKKPSSDSRKSSKPSLGSKHPGLKRKQAQETATKPTEAAAPLLQFDEACAEVSKCWNNGLEIWCAYLEGLMKARSTLDIITLQSELVKKQIDSSCSQLKNATSFRKKLLSESFPSLKKK